MPEVSQVAARAFVKKLANHIGVVDRGFEEDFVRSNAARWKDFSDAQFNTVLMLMAKYADRIGFDVSEIEDAPARPAGEAWEP